MPTKTYFRPFYAPNELKKLSKYRKNIAKRPLYALKSGHFMPLVTAANNPDVLKSPAPDVIFLRFGDSSLDFILRVWNISMVHKRLVLVSALNFEISRKFEEHGIQIPFPQRDLWIRNPLLLQPGKRSGAED
jgi:small-conductance mechanosensitive channel